MDGREPVGELDPYDDDAWAIDPADESTWPVPLGTYPPEVEAELQRLAKGFALAGENCEKYAR
jgi:hypothetical protein